MNNIEQVYYELSALGETYLKQLDGIIEKKEVNTLIQYIILDIVNNMSIKDICKKNKERYNNNEKILELLTIMFHCYFSEAYHFDTHFFKIKIIKEKIN